MLQCQVITEFEELLNCVAPAQFVLPFSVFWAAATNIYPASCVYFLHLPLCEICQDKDFLWLMFSRVGRESTILTLCGKIRVRKYPYSGTFYTAYIILRTYTLFYKHEVNLGQLQICLRYLRFEPQSMLKIYLCVEFRFAYFNLNAQSCQLTLEFRNSNYSFSNLKRRTLFAFEYFALVAVASLMVVFTSCL